MAHAPGTPLSPTTRMGDGLSIRRYFTTEDEHPFDARQTTCLAMGIVAETFWRMPGVLRSDSPHAFAAIGPAAARITADHPIELVVSDGLASSTNAITVAVLTTSQALERVISLVNQSGLAHPPGAQHAALNH